VQFDSGATAKETLRQLCELAGNTIQQIFADVLKSMNLREKAWPCWPGRLRTPHAVSVF
jgi:hypothetical protein